MTETRYKSPRQGSARGLVARKEETEHVTAEFFWNVRGVFPPVVRGSKASRTSSPRGPYRLGSCDDLVRVGVEDSAGRPFHLFSTSCPWTRPGRSQ